MDTLLRGDLGLSKHTKLLGAADYIKSLDSRSKILVRDYLHLLPVIDYHLTSVGSKLRLPYLLLRMF